MAIEVDIDYLLHRHEHHHPSELSGSYTAKEVLSGFDQVKRALEKKSKDVSALAQYNLIPSLREIVDSYNTNQITAKQAMSVIDGMKERARMYFAQRGYTPFLSDLEDILQEAAMTLNFDKGRLTAGRNTLQRLTSMKQTMESHQTSPASDPEKAKAYGDLISEVQKNIDEERKSRSEAESRVCKMVEKLVEYELQIPIHVKSQRLAGKMTDRVHRMLEELEK